MIGCLRTGCRDEDQVHIMGARMEMLDDASSFPSWCLRFVVLHLRSSSKGSAYTDDAISVSA